MLKPSIHNEKEAEDSLSEALLPHGVGYEDNFRSAEVFSYIEHPLLG